MNPKDRVGLTKVQVGLLPAAGIIHGAMACENGAKKYGPYNWREEKILYTVYLDAIERHLLALRDGEDKAGDSGVHHLGHIIAGASIALDAIASGTLIDDRPTRGAAAEMLAAFTKPATPSVKTVACMRKWGPCPAPASCQETGFCPIGGVLREQAGYRFVDDPH